MERVQDFIISQLGNMVIFGLPFTFTLIVFWNIDTVNPKIHETFLSNIITIDGIFLGLTIILFSFAPMSSPAKNILESLVKKIGEKIKITTIWIGLIAPLIVSMVLALAALLQTGLLITIYTVGAFMLMSIGMMNLIVTIAKSYIFSALENG